MKYVRLDYGREITITDEAYEQIAAIVAEQKVCRVCGNRFTPHVPNVALNLCLEHFQKRNEHPHLTYVRVWETNQQGDTIHWFIDSEGFIHYTSTSSDDASKSPYFTLLHWGFPVPETSQNGEEIVSLPHWHWSVYGLVMTDPVVLITNSLEYGSTKLVEFLSYRGKQAMPISRRKGEGRRLFIEAKKRLEATREGGKGAYHWQGHILYGLESYWLMKVVAHIASEEYTASQQLFPSEGQAT